MLLILTIYTSRSNFNSMKPYFSDVHKSIPNKKVSNTIKVTTIFKRCNKVKAQLDGKGGGHKIMLEVISVGSNLGKDKFTFFWGRILVVISVDLTSNPDHPDTSRSLPGSSTEGPNCFPQISQTPA